MRPRRILANFSIFIALLFALLLAHPVLANDSQLCASSANKDSYGGHGAGHSLWLPGIGKDFVFEAGPGSFVETANGARLTGVVRRASDPLQAFEVSVQLANLTKQAPAGSPKKELSSSAYVENGGPVDTSTWTYYPDFAGTLTGIDAFEGAVIEVTRRGPAFQVGLGASGKNVNLGGSGWINWAVLEQPQHGRLQSSGHGDFNIDLAECVEICLKKAKSDADYHGGNSKHAVWLPGIGKNFVFKPDPGSFYAQTDGTAHLVGRIERRNNANQAFDVDVFLTGYQETAPPGSPKKELNDSAYVENGGPVDTNDWWYYTGVTGTLTGLGDYAGALLEIERTGPAFQIGVGANGKNVNLGASSWFNWTVIHQPYYGKTFPGHKKGDFNLDFVECPDGPGGGGDEVWCPRGRNWWKKRPHRWPVSKLTIGGVLYNQHELIHLLEGSQTDMSLKLISHYIAAKLNVLNGGDPSIQPVLDAANAFLAANPPGCDPRGATKREARELKNLLRDYNKTSCGDEPALGSIGDFVWNDQNADGIQDAGEPGLGNVLVTLLDADNNVVATTTTDATGGYLFPDVAAGDYTIVVDAATLPPGSLATFDLDGKATVNESSVTLGEGETLLDADFGYVRLGSLGDTVWNDANGDGVQDAGEAGIPGVTVILTDAGGNSVSAVTDANGNYTFTDLFAGEYTVSVDASTLPANSAATYDLDGTATLNTANVILAEGEDRTDADFGYVPLGSIGDTVWNDLDGNTTQDAGEAGLAGVFVSLVDASGTVVATATTDANGNYLFTGLLAGNYSVTVDPASLPAGATPTYDADGVGTPHVAAAPLAPGENRLDLDFGYRLLGTMGDRVWDDANDDGVQDPGEPGLEGVRVELRDSAGVLITTTTTDSAGNYLFTDRPSGDYQVTIDITTLPNNYGPTYDLDGIDTPDAVSLTLAPGENNLDIDFGYRNTCSQDDIYGVHDNDLNDSQIFKLDTRTGEAIPLGPLYPALDIESLDMHPTTRELYGAASLIGDFFRIDKETGDLELIGNLGTEKFKEIAALSFHPDGTLWGFQKNIGLITIDLDTAVTTRQWRAPINDPIITRKWDAIAWNQEGTVVWGSERAKLYRWDLATETVELVCGDGFLPDKTEGLDVDPAGNLIGGWHNESVDSLRIFEIDPVNCTTTDQEFDIPYNDIESLAFEICE